VAPGSRRGAEDRRGAGNRCGAGNRRAAGDRRGAGKSPWRRGSPWRREPLWRRKPPCRRGPPWRREVAVAPRIAVAPAGIAVKPHSRRCPRAVCRIHIAWRGESGILSTGPECAPDSHRYPRSIRHMPPGARRVWRSTSPAPTRSDRFQRRRRVAPGTTAATVAGTPRRAGPRLSSSGRVPEREDRGRCRRSRTRSSHHPEGAGERRTRCTRRRRRRHRPASSPPSMCRTPDT
jgi:hypothetical protein